MDDCSTDGTFEKIENIVKELQIRKLKLKYAKIKKHG